jgi:hypothetical protein
MVKCDVCGAERASVHWLPEHLPVKLADNVEITLSPTVPVISCEECGERYTDERGADIREEAVKIARIAYELGRLKGAETEV